MERYTIIVTIKAKDQPAAFRFVEQAIEDKLTKEQMQDHCDGDVSVSTPDGTSSVVW